MKFILLCVGTLLLSASLLAKNNVEIQAEDIGTIDSFVSVVCDPCVLRVGSEEERNHNDICVYAKVRQDGAGRKSRAIVFRIKYGEYVASVEEVNETIQEGAVVVTSMRPRGTPNPQWINDTVKLRDLFALVDEWDLRMYTFSRRECVRGLYACKDYVEVEVEFRQKDKVALLARIYAGLVGIGGEQFVVQVYRNRKK